MFAHLLGATMLVGISLILSALHRALSYKEVTTIYGIFLLALVTVLQYSRYRTGCRSRYLG